MAIVLLESELPPDPLAAAVAVMRAAGVSELSSPDHSDDAAVRVGLAHGEGVLLCVLGYAGERQHGERVPPSLPFQVMELPPCISPSTIFWPATAEVHTGDVRDVLEIEVGGHHDLDLRRRRGFLLVRHGEVEQVPVTGRDLVREQLGVRECARCERKSGDEHARVRGRSSHGYAIHVVLPLVAW